MTSSASKATPVWLCLIKSFPETIGSNTPLLTVLPLPSTIPAFTVIFVLAVHDWLLLTPSNVAEPFGNLIWGTVNFTIWLFAKDNALDWAPNVFSKYTDLLYVLLILSSVSAPIYTCLLSVANPISPGRKGWGKSCFRPRLCCILLIITFKFASSFADIIVIPYVYVCIYHFIRNVECYL